jgi:hypothetical protein
MNSHQTGAQPTTHTSTKPSTHSVAAATDVGEFITDLDGGQFDRKLSIALSQVAAACLDNKRTGEVTVKFVFEPLLGTQQVACHHELKFLRPTMDGKAGEQEKRVTVLHVGRYGALSLAQPALIGQQGDMLGHGGS